MTETHLPKNTAQGPQAAPSPKAAGKMTERLLAVQVLYGIAMNPGRINNNISDSLASIKRIMGEELSIGDHGKNEYSLSLVESYQSQRDMIIDRVIDSLAGGEPRWRMLETILQIILCLGVAELAMKKQSPAIIISSWVEVAKSYFADQSPKIIHAVLDSVNKKNSNPLS